MKYLLGLLGLFFAFTCVWAAPEEMTMYATLSAPMASFWNVKTLGENPVTMGNDTSLNLWAGDGEENEKGTLSVSSNEENTFYIDILNMGDKTQFEVGAATIWYVQEVTIGNEGKATFDGDVIIKTLNFSEGVTGTQEITVNNEGKLILGSGALDKTKSLSFSKVEVAIGDNEKFDFYAENQNLSTKSVKTTNDTDKIIYMD